jgi:hypothetical protein
VRGCDVCVFGRVRVVRDHESLSATTVRDYSVRRRRRRRRRVSCESRLWESSSVRVRVRVCVSLRESA